jgi:WG containing repeat
MEGKQVRMSRYILICFLLSHAAAFAQKSGDNLFSFFDSTSQTYGFRDQSGEVIIPSGKYVTCFTDTLRQCAIVGLSGDGLVAIDHQGRKLYPVFVFDNGPDYVSDGLFRIVRNGKIGFADGRTGSVVIKPQFKCAWPFEKGKAKVAIDCSVKRYQEHSSWASDTCFISISLDTRLHLINKLLNLNLCIEQHSPASSA